MKQILLKKNILAKNDIEAEKNRRFLTEQNILTINLLGSPGAGKTTFLEKLLQKLSAQLKIAVIEGDLYTTQDAVRLQQFPIEVVQLNTQGGCHLDATMISEGLTCLNTDELELLIIENIGNLVCPASYDLSEDLRLVIMSVTEGNDKPLKYPAMFEKASVILLNKIDLLPFTNFDTAHFYHDIQSLNPHATVFEISSYQDQGLQAVVDYLQQQMKRTRDASC